MQRVLASQSFQDISTVDKVLIRLQWLASGAVAGRRNRRGCDAQAMMLSSGTWRGDTGSFQSRQIPQVRWYLTSPEELGAAGFHMIPDQAFL